MKLDKVTGEEAANLLRSQHSIYTAAETRYFLVDNKDLFYIGDGNVPTPSQITLDQIESTLDIVWYKEAPFDIRYEMKWEPDKWVGGFYHDVSDAWYLVGFNWDSYTVVSERIYEASQLRLLKVKKGTLVPDAKHLDKCVPLEKVISALKEEK